MVANTVVGYLKSSPCDFQPGIVLLECRLWCALQEGHNKRFHNVCDVTVRCQIAVRVRQRCPVINTMPPQTMMLGVGPLWYSVKWVGS
ncbi:hypothetical protein TNCV_5072211 [Trichonephila clavipes]|nr:hypothetical protein TNCV_5072211 [Trichonephila clavipes]